MPSSAASVPAGPRAPGGGRPVHRTTRLEEVDDATRGAWTRLAAHQGNPFLTPTWTRAFRRHLAAGPVWVVSVAGDGGPIALTALAESVLAGQRVLRFPGARVGGHFGPVVGRRVDGIADLAEDVVTLARQRRAVVLLEHIDEDAPWWGAFTAAARSLRLTRLSTTETPIVDTPAGGWDEYLAGRSGELRRQLGKKMRRARRDHEAGVETSPPTADPAEAVERFLHLHRAAWEGRGGSALDDPRLEGFVREAVTGFQGDRALRVCAIHMDGEAGAMVVGFAVGAPVYLFQTGMDPRWERYSLGQLAYAEALRSAMEDGAPWIDLGEGTQAYKMRFATRTATRADYLVTSTSDPRGLLAPALVALRARASDRGRYTRFERALRGALRPGAVRRRRGEGAPSGGAGGEDAPSSGSPAAPARGS